MQGGRGGWSIGAMKMEWQVVGCGQAANKCGVFFGCGSADAVVDVDHGKHDAQRVALLEQAPEQGHGVGAPGDRDGDPLARTKESLRRVSGGCMAASMLPGFLLRAV